MILRPRTTRGQFMKLLKELPAGMTIYTDFRVQDIRPYAIRAKFKVRLKVLWVFRTYGKSKVELKKITEVRKLK